MTTSILRFVLFGTAFLVLASACTNRPTAEDVVDEVTPVICEKAKECYGEAFSATYPGGTSECISKTKAAVSKKYGDDLERASKCTDDELDECMDKFKSAACGENGGLPDVPCDC